MLSLHCFVHELNATKLKFYFEDDYVQLYRLSKCLSLLRTVLNSSSYEMTPGGGTLGNSEWGCAAGTLEPLTYTRAS